MIDPLVVVVKRHRRLLLGRNLVGGFFQRLQAGADGADRGQKSNNAKQHNDPHSQLIAGSEPVGQNQEKAQAKQDGKPKLSHPKQQRKQLHFYLLISRDVVYAIPSYYTP